MYALKIKNKVEFNKDSKWVLDNHKQIYKKFNDNFFNTLKRYNKEQQDQYEEFTSVI